MHVVKFNPTSSSAATLIPKPKPARLYHPDWYASMPAFHEGVWQIGREKEDEPYGNASMTLKMCTPVSDALNSGYIQEAWQDIYISFDKNNSEEADYVLPMPEPSMISKRDMPSFPTGDDFYPIEFVFHPPWTPQTPKGWSTLYTHPQNRPDLPFWFPSGIVDTDRFTHTCEKSNMPFYVKKSFTSGIIPKGTPLYQMIPVKRESWKSSEEVFDEIKQKKICLEPHKNFWGGYKKNFWQKKEYR